MTQEDYTRDGDPDYPVDPVFLALAGDMAREFNLKRVDYKELSGEKARAIHRIKSKSLCEWADKVHF